MRIIWKKNEENISQICENEEERLDYDKVYIILSVIFIAIFPNFKGEIMEQFKFL